MTQTAPSITSTHSKESRVGVLGAFFLSLLVFSGQLKETALFGWMDGAYASFGLPNVDLTVLTAALFAVSIVRSRVSQGAATPFVFLPLLLWVVFLIPAIYAPPASGFEKLAILFTITLMLALAPFYLLRTEIQRRWFLWTTVVIGVLTAFLVLTTGTTVAGYASRYILEGTDTIGTARIAGAGGVICLIFALARGTKPIYRLVLIFAGALLLVLAFATGSRGPVIAAGAALVVAALFSPAFKKYRVRVAVVVAIVGVGAFAVASTRSADGLNRILAFFSSSEGDASTQIRDTLAEIATTTFGQNLNGIGWGNFSAYDGLFQYPHNMFLEIPLEAGWAAGVTFVVLVIAAGIRYLVIPQDPTQVAMFALFVFAAINASVSSDVNGNRLLWVALFAAFAVLRERDDDDFSQGKVTGRRAMGRVRTEPLPTTRAEARERTVQQY